MIKFRMNAFAILRKLAWQAESDRLVTLAVHGHSYAAAFWTSDGQLAHTAYLGRDRDTLPAFGGNVFAVAVNDRVHLRNPAGEDMYEVHLEHPEGANVVALDTDGTWLVSVLPWPDYEFQSTIHVHELHTLGAVHHCTFFASGRVDGVVLDPGRRFLLATSDIGITIWDLAKKESVLALPLLGIRSGLWSPDSRAIILRRAHHVECRSASDGVSRWTQPLTAENSAAMLAINPDGAAVAAIDGEIVRLLAATDGLELAAYHWDIGSLAAVAFAGDGLTIAAGSRDGQIVIWDVA